MPFFLEMGILALSKGIRNSQHYSIWCRMVQISLHFTPNFWQLFHLFISLQLSTCLPIFHFFYRTLIPVWCNFLCCLRTDLSIPYVPSPRSCCIHHTKFCEDVVVRTCTQWGINWNQQRHFLSNFQRCKVSSLLCNQTLGRSLLLIVTFFGKMLEDRSLEIHVLQIILIELIWYAQKGLPS